MRRIVVTSLVLVSMGCTPHQDPKPAAQRATPAPGLQQLEVPKKPEPEPPVPVHVAVSSAQLYQDCPDASPKAAAPESMAQRQGEVNDEFLGEGSPARPPSMQGKTSIRPGVAAAYPPPCTQSWLQLTFTSSAEEPLKVEIKDVHVVAASSKEVGPQLQVRSPSVWDSTQGFLPWDERVPTGSSKASYKLGAKDWDRITALVEMELYYFVEVEIMVGGELRTIRSPDVSKAPVEVMVT